MAKKPKPAKKPAKNFKPRFERIPAAPPRSPKIEKEPAIVKTEKTFYRCIAENTTRGNRFEHSRRFGPGQIIDLDEAIGKGSTLREHVRHSCFEPIRAGGE